MKRLTFFLLLSMIALRTQSQSKGNSTAEPLERGVYDTEILTSYFIDQISSPFRNEANQKIQTQFPYAPTDSETLSLVNKYYSLIHSLDFKIEDLTNKSYLKKLQENSAVKDFQSELYDQIKSLKEDFQQDTKEALGGIGKE